MSSHQEGRVRCPACKAECAATVRQLIAAEDLAVKAAYVQGRLHSVSCAACGASFTPPVPTLYFDPDKALALVFAPGATDLRELTAALRRALPAERLAKAMLPPRRLPSREALVRAILAADGLTEELLRAQAARMELLEALLQSPSEEALREQARAHDAELDRGFFELLTARMQAAQLGGDQNGAQTLLAFRTCLGQWSTQGKAAIAAIDAELGLSVIQSREELLAQLSRADEADRPALVAQGLALLDTSFFQLLDAEADRAAASGDGAGARELVLLRASLLKLKAEQEAQTHANLQRAAALFAQVVGSPQPDQVLAENRAALDESFFVVLGANLERARRQGQSEPARALELIGQYARSVSQGG
jgi:CpXC protein